MFVKSKLKRALNSIGDAKRALNRVMNIEKAHNNFS